MQSRDNVAEVNRHILFKRTLQPLSGAATNNPTRCISREFAVGGYQVIFTPGTRAANDEGDRQHRRHGESMTLLAIYSRSEIKVGNRPTELRAARSCNKISGASKYARVEFCR